MSREELLTLILAQAKTIEMLTDRVAELERQLASDSSNSSRPPSSDAPWSKAAGEETPIAYPVGP
jgi:transposase